MLFKRQTSSKYVLVKRQEASYWQHAKTLQQKKKSDFEENKKKSVLLLAWLCRRAQERGLVIAWN